MSKGDGREVLGVSFLSVERFNYWIQKGNLYGLYVISIEGLRKNWIEERILYAVGIYVDWGLRGTRMVMERE